jgi:hypothetical protein
MRTKRIVIILCVIAFLTCLSYAEAATIRGRLDRVTNFGVSPAMGIAVTVSSPSAGRSYPAYTDNYGFYYLYNIPPGNYNLEVWVTNSPLVWTIQVPPVQQYDVFPIKVQ